MAFRFPPEAVSFDALNYLQGVTYEHSVVILDEAQNADYDELKVFLTRLGAHSKLLVLGDPTQSQIDATSRTHPTDLDEMVSKLQGLKGVAVVTFPACESVRHPLVGRLLRRL